MKGLVTGLEATGRELDSVFARHGIAKVEAIGQKLDPNRHQAMMEVPSADAEPGTVVQEIQSGYVLKDRLLRPALVGVAKAADPSPPRGRRGGVRRCRPSAARRIESG